MAFASLTSAALDVLLMRNTIQATDRTLAKSTRKRGGTNLYWIRPAGAQKATLLRITSTNFDRSSWPISSTLRPSMRPRVVMKETLMTGAKIVCSAAVFTRTVVSLPGSKLAKSRSTRPCQPVASGDTTTVPRVNWRTMLSRSGGTLRPLVSQCRSSSATTEMRPDATELVATGLAAICRSSHPGCLDWAPAMARLPPVD
mmetsp:Transcript_37463/g.84454  ORF Transcript_37463/g.84454 Transcript_37463/m.84454 type:complete len:200 (-) Transcript_37463:54-653(-)